MDKFVQCSPLHHNFKGVWFAAYYRGGLLNQFIKPVGVAGSNAAPPADYSQLQCTGHNRLVIDL